MRRWKKNQLGRVSQSTTPEGKSVIDWVGRGREAGDALPVLELYRWSDLVQLPDKVAAIVRGGVGGSSSQVEGGESDASHREVEQDGDEIQG